ncbi:ribosome biogenesis GTPase YlqF [Candidatus Phytoplasma phoenicium]|uniref:Ribosome biogenesis GTPase A n=1 Tax=Candidatus Phytoplasma phoenicium TaxID=198422 RepID=A0A0L0MKD0_9MOLU|nr:ribosome biogenesis GTPase YlqF [Candidatus Phytoplasma phoenicium]KND62750.1 50S ribosome-binding GTPase [Candidatus Phytoplasma phoenicium]
MTKIHWFPGHMKKSLREIQTKLKLVNCLLVILDARIPFSSINWELLKSLNNKPFLILLNKSSLADEKQNKFFIEFLQRKQFPYLFIDVKYKKNIHCLLPRVKQILCHYMPNYPKILKLMVVGIPNVGKSTLINVLSQRKAMITANTPGITKQLQWINLSDNIRLMDTPGILYPKITNPLVGYSLALCSCIKETLFSTTELLEYVLSFFQKYYPQNLEKLFALTKKETQQKNLFQVINQKNKNLLTPNKMFFIILNKIKKEKITKVNFDINLISLLL